MTSFREIYTQRVINLYREVLLFGNTDREKHLGRLLDTLRPSVVEWNYICKEARRKDEFDFNLIASVKKGKRK